MTEQYDQVAVVIPAFNEARSIREVVTKTLKYVTNVIVVDDGSTDDTVAQIKDLPITILRNEQNCGKAACLLRGFGYSKNKEVDAVITLDADRQHDPDDIPRFIKAMQQYSNHLIIGARTDKKQKAPKARYRANITADFFISWAGGHRVMDSQSGFRLYPQKLVDYCLLYAKRNNNFVFESEVVIRAARQGYLPVCLPIASYYPSDARPSYFKPVRDTTRIVRMVTWKIISHGFYPVGLFRSLFKSKLKKLSI